MNSWPTKKMWEVAILNPKKSEVRDLPDDTSVSFVPMPSVDEYAQAITRREIKQLGSVRKGYTYFKNDDVLFAKITPCMENGKVAVARDLENGVGFGSTEFHVLRPTNKITSEWIFHIVASSAFREEAEKHMQGAAGQRRVPISFLANYEIPVPPIEEQGKIVEKIEKQFAKIDEVARLRTKSLVATDQLIPAALHKIFSLAESKEWEVQTLGEVCEKTLNIKWSEHKDNNFQYIDLSSVSRESFLITESQKVNSQDAPSRARKLVETDDVLFGTTRPTLMRVTIVPPSYDNQLCSTGFSVLRARKEKILPQFIYFYLRSSDFMCRMEELQTGASYPAVSDTIVMQTKIPLPPLAEQKEIVKKLNALSEKACALRELQLAQSADLKALKQSILHEAFAGEVE